MHIRFRYDVGNPMKIPAIFSLQHLLVWMESRGNLWLKGLHFGSIYTCIKMSRLQIPIFVNKPGGLLNWFISDLPLSHRRVHFWHYLGQAWELLFTVIPHL